MSSQMITVSIGGVLVSGIHAHVGVVQRRFLWSEMELISDLKQPWLAIGDFNSIVSSDEKIGGRATNRRVMQEFNTCLDNCELIQAPKSGLQFSWSNCQHGNKRILSGSASIPKPSNIPFKFQKMWLSHPGFMDLVSNCWNEDIVGDPAFVLLQKLKRLKNILRDWNWNMFGNVHVKIKEAEEEVQKAMKLSDNNPTDAAMLNNLVMAENNHNSREIRQSRNFISKLEDSNGDIISDQKKIAYTLVNHFEQKFQFQETEEADSLLEVIPEVITKEDQQMLDAVPNEEEIKEAIFSMNPKSSPGPDGFSTCFYKACWHIIHTVFVQAIRFCWQRRFIPKGLNSNFLVMLPKVEGAKSPNHFRPIGLSNVNFKTITKIINTRMSSLMTKMISPQQVAYIKGRSIQEQIILASELVNGMRKKRRGGNVALKLDISQAYNSVNWQFLFQVLSKYGFSTSWCQWLQTLYESAKISVMINGGPQGFFSVGRGLRQGSGQIINKTKSKLFIDGTSVVRKNQIKDLMQMELSHFPDKYLGVILAPGKFKVSTVWTMVEMIQKKLASWKGKLLSFQDRVVLIKSVLCSILLYNMAVYKWPSSVIKWAWSSLKDNIKWCIGNGNNINVWFDNWIGDTPLIEKVGMHDYAKNNLSMKVSQLIQNNQWNIPSELQQMITSMRLSDIVGEKDLLIWTGHMQGKFTTSSAVSILRHKEPILECSKHIWNYFLHPSTTSNVWKIIQGIYVNDPTMVKNGYDSF
ncbi:uncharacterized protein LOC113294854 [Papaver somniferum]|uniref:uncharacterized protein LOC113294854 n=1 Tax=Papaver somniferum TaxID=3469 RepID=UPI000E6FB805|nr:uncharacterized protein LOC113294854 [Papaver somniferum]